MAATERLSLLLESRTTGRDEIAQLEQAIGRVTSIAQSTRKEIDTVSNSAKDLAVAIGLAAAAGKVFTETAQGVIAVGRAYQEARGPAGVLVDTYRGLRIAVAAATSESAVYFATATVGAGLVAEKLLGIASAQGKVIEQNALLAAQTKASFASVQTFTAAGVISGTDLSFLNAFNPDSVRDYITELQRIPDPIDRARRANEIFGKDADKALSLVGTRINDTIRDAQQLASNIDGPTRASIQRLRDDFKGFEASNPFSAIAEWLRRLRDDAKQGITIRIAALFDAGRNAKLPQSVQQGLIASGGFGAEGGAPFISSRDQELLNLPSYDDFRRMLPGVVGGGSRFTVDSNGNPIPIGPGLPSLVTAGQRSAAGAAAIARSSSLESLRSQLAAAQASANVAATAVQTGGPLAESSALALLQAEKLVATLESQIKTIERLKEAEEGLSRLRKSVQQDVEFGGLTPVQRRQAEAVAQFGPGAAAQFNPLLVREQQDAFARLRAGGRALTADGVRAADTGAQQTLEDQTRLFQFSLGRSIAADSEFVSKAKEALREANQLDKQRLDIQTRLIALTTGPGGELAAIREIAQIRLASATSDIERADIVLDREEKIKNLRKAQDAESRDSAGRIFDAIVQGGGGIRSLLLGTLGTTGRTAFQNVSQEFVSGARGRLALPGQTNEDGTLSFLGRLLKGTPFGIDQNKLATDLNTTATNLNTQALLAVSGAGAGSGISSVLAQFGGSIRASNSTAAASAEQFAVPGFLGVTQDASGNISGAAGAARGSAGNLARGVGIAGALAGGAFGVTSGIRQGGIRGATTAVGSGAGAAAALLPLIGISGPAAPILAGVALAAALIPTFLPDPKKQRAEFQDRTLAGAQYVSPAAMNYAWTTGGGSFDYGKYGNMRPIIINQNMNNLDAKSFIDRRSDIAEATRLAMQEAHGINDEIMGVVRAA